MRNVGRWRNNRDCNSQRDKRKHISRRFQFGVYYDIPDKQNALFTIAENGRFLRNKALFSLSHGTFYKGIKHPSKTATSPYDCTATRPCSLFSNRPAAYRRRLRRRTVECRFGSTYIPPAPRQTAQTAAAFPDTAGRTNFFVFLFATTQENAYRAHFISERPVIE